VLNIINSTENKELFDKQDKEIEEDFEIVKKAWESKRQTYDMYKRMKENHSDFDYFADNAFF